MPSSSSARITRTAISPRLATRTLENMGAAGYPPGAGTRRPPGIPPRSLLVDLRRVDAAVGVGVQHPQPHAGARRLDRVVRRARPRGRVQYAVGDESQNVVTGSAALRRS